MRCLVCEKVSWKLLCPGCRAEKLTPALSRRSLPCGLEVLSFYRFEEIDYLLKSKYTPLGSKIYTLLADHAFRPFAENFEYHATIHALGIDDTVAKGYAHTAILARALNSRIIRPQYGKLLAQNPVQYAGKSLAFRLQNPRNFRYTGTKTGVILIDDLITTGTTLCEAKAAVERAGGSVLFALTLADAKE
jgi:competence protein ComFC